MRGRWCAVRNGWMRIFPFAQGKHDTWEEFPLNIIFLLYRTDGGVILSFEKGFYLHCREWHLVAMSSTFERGILLLEAYELFSCHSNHGVSCQWLENASGKHLQIYNNKWRHDCIFFSTIFQKKIDASRNFYTINSNSSVSLERLSRAVDWGGVKISAIDFYRADVGSPRWSSRFARHLLIGRQFLFRSPYWWRNAFIVQRCCSFCTGFWFH